MGAEPIVRTFFWFCLLADAFSIYVVSESWNRFCDKPLQYYVLASAVLGTPLTMSLHFLPLSVRTHFYLDGGSALLYFALTTIGTSWTNTAVMCPSTAPLLWWWSFVNNALAWTLIIAYLSLTLVLTVAGVIVNQKKPASGKGKELKASSLEPLAAAADEFSGAAKNEIIGDGGHHKI